MIGRHRAALGAAAFALVVAGSRPAYAMQDSLRGPFYVQGVVASFAIQSDTGNGVYWHPDVEFGWHPTGRHDGFVVGVRQGFDINGDCSLGETVARLGYDIALPLKNGRFELTIAPYGIAGVDYVFPCGPASAHAGLRLGAGIEIKFFLYKGFYLLARPAETDLADYADMNNPVHFYFNSGIGIGFGF